MNFDLLTTSCSLAPSAFYVLAISWLAEKNIFVIYLYMKTMWNYSEAFTSHRYKTIILYFLTTTCRSCSLVKLHVWINHVDTWRRFDDDTTSMRLHIYFVSTLKQLCLSKGMQLNSVKSIFLGFWAMVQSSYTVM